MIDRRLREILDRQRVLLLVCMCPACILRRAIRGAMIFGWIDPHLAEAALRRAVSIHGRN